MSRRKPAQDRRQDILSATLDLAFEVGPDHVTTGLIARRLGLSQPALYKHFPSKQDIWLAVTNTLCARIDANTALLVPDSAKPRALLRQMILAHLDLVQQVPALPEIMVTRDPSGALSATRQRIQAAMARFRAALLACFEQMQRLGQVTAGQNTEDCVSLLIGLIQGLVLRLIVTRNTERLMQDGARLLDLQLALFDRTGDLQ